MSEPDELAAAQAAQADAERRALALEVAAEKGLTGPLAARLQGNTREELEADVRTLMALFPGPAAPPAPRSGGSRGVDVRASNGSVQAGMDLYHEKNPPKPEPKPMPGPNDRTHDRGPTYRFER
ncbi:hypothetical protein KNE206_18570 [Kitasatospora sp. NE20-6]|uniref:hypothetical protein n=1 Tax=Kitasatospora sp. NE20-6 TaxID=2859066 RepID=UPI0034DC52CB